MITTVPVQGSRETTWHNFTVEQEGMTLTVSPGSYWRGGVKLVTLEEPVTITINQQEEDKALEVWVCTIDGSAQFELYETGDSLSLLTYSIDRIAWFTVPAGAETLDEVEISAIRISDV